MTDTAPQHIADHARAVRLYEIAHTVVVEFAAFAAAAIPHLPEEARAEYRETAARLVNEATHALAEVVAPETPEET